jgi:hypothetical protein
MQRLMFCDAEIDRRQILDLAALARNHLCGLLQGRLARRTDGRTMLHHVHGLRRYQLQRRAPMVQLAAGFLAALAP